MKFDYITSEIREDIGIVTINNQQTLNSISAKVLSELAEKMKEYDHHKSIKVIVLKGVDKSFAAGLDIRAIAAEINDAKEIIESMQHDFEAIKNTSKPVIAAISGFSLGIGCELALSCDIVLATENSRFGLPELSVGLLPCFGGCSALASRIGKAKAMDVILSGKALSADEAERAGLISRIVTPESLEEEFMKLARRIALLPQNTVVTAKKLIKACAESSLAATENLCSLYAVESGEFKQILLSYAVKKPSETEKA